MIRALLFESRHRGNRLPARSHPWMLSICNSLLSGHWEEALTHVKRTSMDKGVACESVHEDTGECVTGFAFATCAGFLAYALMADSTQSEAPKQSLPARRIDH